MDERRRFDPVGWFVSASFAVLAAAIALVVAVDLLRSIWPWVVGSLLLGTVLVCLVRFVLWRRGRQPW